METGLHLRILTPAQKLVDETEVEEVYVYTSEGMLAIMPGYAPIITDLSIGIVTYTKKNISGILRTSGGVVRVEEGGKVTILADVAEEASQIDLARAQQSLERADAKLSTELSDSDRRSVDEAKLRAMARIEAVQQYNLFKH